MTVRSTDPLQVHFALEMNCIHFAVEYRKSPEYKMPTAALDFYTAIKHVAANAE